MELFQHKYAVSYNLFHYFLFFSKKKLMLNGLEFNLDSPEGVKLSMGDYFWYNSVVK